MTKYINIKTLFLIATIFACVQKTFSLLITKEDYEQILYVLVESGHVHACSGNQNSLSAHERHTLVTKYNTLLEHYKYMVTQLIEKNNHNENDLKKIESSLDAACKEIKNHGIDALINTHLVEQIRTSILYLRILACKNEKR
ncbi:hypothetical protein FJ364_03965 [Candidatus Dependentiae bacterium]|nr:hypothetical protein [Candidatus Dependentiae bacterium]